MSVYKSGYISTLNIVRKVKPKLFFMFYGKWFLWYFILLEYYYSDHECAFFFWCVFLVILKKFKYLIIFTMVFVFLPFSTWIDGIRWKLKFHFMLFCNNDSISLILFFSFFVFVVRIVIHIHTRYVIYLILINYSIIF